MILLGWLEREVVGREPTGEGVTDVEILMNPGATATLSTGIEDRDGENCLVCWVPCQGILPLETGGELESDVRSCIPLQLSVTVHRGESENRDGVTHWGLPQNACDELLR